MIKGIDISHWQGKMDFDKLKDLIKFIIIKATEGTYYTDTEFSRNQIQARWVGIPLGYYHFARPEYSTSPEVEAEYFVKTIGKLQEGEVLVLDYESNWTGDVVSWCYRFLNRVFSLTNVRPLIYLNQYLLNRYDWSKIINESFGLWLAKYDGDSSIPDTSWPTLAMKQFTNALDITNQKVDGDYFFGSVETFKKYGYQIEVVPPVVIDNSDEDTKKALETLTAYKISNNHGNLQGAINDLIGKSADLKIANEKNIELSAEIVKLTTENGTNSNLLSECQSTLSTANKNDDTVKENDDVVEEEPINETSLNIIQEIIGFIKNLFIKK